MADLFAEVDKLRETLLGREESADRHLEDISR